MASTRGLLAVKVIAGAVLMNIAALLVVDAANLSSKFDICQPKEKDFQKCFRDSLDKAMAFLVKGNREFKLVPLDPLHIPEMHLGDLNGPASFLLKFENCYFYGMAGMKIISAKFDPEKYFFDISLKLPRNVISGPYDVNGRVLLLPIKGSGMINFTCDEPHINWKIQGKPVSRNGKTYFDIQTFKLTTSKINTGSVYLSNLFDGDKTLGDGMNRLLNENFKDVINTVLPFFDETMGAIFKGLAKRIFDQLPYDEIFPKL